MTDEEEAALKERFHQEMLSIYAHAKAEAGDNATRFLQMVPERGGYETVVHLLSGEATDVSEGFTRLALKGRLTSAGGDRSGHLSRIGTGASGSI